MKGQERFQYYLNQLARLFTEAEKDKSPAFYLYSHDARTTCFMLEGLARICRFIYNEKKFSKILNSFKQLEDAIGAIDFYDNLSKEFKANARTPITVTVYYKTKMQEKVAQLNKLLIKENWILSDKNKLEKINKKLSQISWMSDKQEIKGVKNFYIDSIEDIAVLALESQKGFTELEEEVHELRRKLRWLSIYPRALQGAIQLSDGGVADESVKMYLTPEIVNSPYNQMPARGDNQTILYLDKNNFLALSWVIAALGKLKDEGLKIEALCEALEQTEEKGREWSMHVAAEMLEIHPNETTSILEKATGISRRYFRGKRLEQLVQNVESV